MSAVNAVSNLKILGGGYDLTPYFTKGSVKGARSTAPDTNLSDTAHRYTGGRISGDLSADGLHSDGADGLQTVQEAIFGVANTAFMVLPEDYDTIGKPYVGLAGTPKDHKVGTPPEGMVDANMSVESNSGLDLGYLLRALATCTGTGASVGIDAGAQTTNGGSAIIVVTVDNVTSATIELQHSSDSTTGSDGVWATIGTFTAVTGITSERIEVARGTTISRWLRLNVTAFSGTAFTWAGGASRYAA